MTSTNITGIKATAATTSDNNSQPIFVTPTADTSPRLSVERHTSPTPKTVKREHSTDLTTDQMALQYPHNTVILQNAQEGGGIPPDPIARSRARLNDDHALYNYREEQVSVYDVSQKFDYGDHEALPQLATTHPRFYRAEALSSELVNIIQQCMEPTHAMVTSVAFTELLLELDATGKTEYDTIRVGVVGDAGAGKSTCLTVLLGKSTLAKSGGSGESCTQVITEYSNDRSMGNTFKGEVTFKPKEQWIEELTGHFNKFADCQDLKRRKGKSSTNLTSAAEDDDELELAEDESTTAQEYLLQLFSAREEFRKKTIQKTLTGLSSTRRATMISELADHVDAALEQHIRKKEQTLTCQTNDLKSLQNSLRPFSEKMRTGRQALWPLVTIIRITLNSPLLRQGLIIADAPGVSDVNASRRQLARNYLRDCPVVLVMGNIDRVLNQASVRRNLQTYALQNGVRRTVLVPTKADIIGMSSEIDEDDSVLVGLLERVDDARELLAADDSLENRDNLTREQANLDRTRIQQRNDNVKQHGNDCVRGRLLRKNETLTVIPTSSHIELEYINGPSMQNPPCLPLGQTGFRELRSILTAFGHAGRVNTLRSKVDELSNQMRRLDYLLDHARIEGSEEMFALLPGPRQRASAQAPFVILELKEHLENMVFSVIDARIHGSDWSSKFSRKLQQLQSSWSHPITIRAFCVHQGTHKPVHADDLIEWNRELAELPIPDLKTLLDAFVNKAKVVLRETVRRQRPKYDEVKDGLILHDQLRLMYLVGDPDPMDQHWNSCIRAFKTGASVLEDQMLRTLINQTSNTFGGEKLKLKERRVLNAAMSETPFYKAMGKIYDDVMDEYLRGTTGITVLRCEYLNEHVPSTKPGSPLCVLAKSVKKALLKTLTDFEEELNAMLIQPYDAVEKDLDALLRENSGLSEEDRAAVRAGLDAVRPELEAKKAKLRSDLNFVIRMTDEADAAVKAEASANATTTADE